MVLALGTIGLAVLLEITFVVVVGLLRFCFRIMFLFVSGCFLKLLLLLVDS